MGNCSNCDCIRKATAVDTTVQITLDNGAAGPFQPFCFLMCTYCTPQPTNTVKMLINGNSVPLWDLYGRPIYSDQLRARKVYRARFVQEGTPHVTVVNLDCCSRQCCARATSATPATALASTSRKAREE